MRLIISLALAVLVSTAGQSIAADNTLVIHAGADKTAPVINKNIYGHFSEHLGRCIYEGYWVGEDSPIPNTRGIRNDVVAALKKIKTPVLRWPGGCFADEYHWMEGIGPRSERPTIVNTHWGGVTENNAFGTHEFLDLCAQLDCEPYICGNVGSGTIREMRDWVEYLTFDGKSPMADLRRKNGREEPWKVTFFGVGNENWGCGGNMTASYYTDMYKHFQTYVRDYGDNKIYKIAGGASGDDIDWTETLMRDAGTMMSGISLHQYVVPGGWSNKGSATIFDESSWYEVLAGGVAMDDLIARHSAVMDKYDPQKNVGLMVDEWGAWYSVEPNTNPGFLYQQNSLRDALFAGIVLNAFNNHADRVKMANIAQTVNVLQAMILTNGADMLLTPTYHTYDLYTVHHDATLLATDLACGQYTAPTGATVAASPASAGTRSIPTLSVSASRDKSGAIHATICNLDPLNASPLTISLDGAAVKTVTGRIITAQTINSYNSFEKKEAVKPAAFTGASVKNGTITAMLPAKSVVMLELK